MKIHPLVSVEWLNTHLTDANLVVLNASMKKAVAKGDSIPEGQLGLMRDMRLSLNRKAFFL